MSESMLNIRAILPVKKGKYPIYGINQQRIGCFLPMK